MSQWHWEDDVMTQGTCVLTQRAQTSANASNLNQKWSSIPIHISRLTRCLPDRSKNVVHSLPCRRQSFRRVLWKSDGDCMRNANKSPIPQWRGKWNCDTESVSGTGSPPKVNQFVWYRLKWSTVIMLSCTHLQDVLETVL